MSHGIVAAILVWSLFGAMARADEAVIASAKAGACDLTVESNEQWQTLRLRAFHPNGLRCQIDQGAMVSVLNAAFARDAAPKPAGIYSSLSIGRLIDYPWLSQYLAVTAYRDRAWDTKKGRPVSLEINRYVAHLLFGKDVLAPLAAALATGGYRVTGVSVEKVLVGGFREVPAYQGAMGPGRLPYDAQVWFRLEHH